ncbi:TerB family tellurite resistance protein [Mucilaginibacter litoreus]|uniref:TerB family tellurite resistance protein n=1 Tax=Mucilaginibacter litoreus TaxID=1048221 RepID=A0ABW3AY37_9SPHI
MKKAILYTIALLAWTSVPSSGRAQSVADCIKQLTLDYEKLASLKGNLNQMYHGFDVLSQGYGMVKDISKGNFSLHETFLNGLLAVSPAVRKYPRAADIITNQASLLKEYKAASRKFLQDPHFSPQVSAYIVEVYDQLSQASLKNLDDLALVMTDSKLRMSDAERLAAIDQLYFESLSQLSFLRRFNDQASKFTLQKSFNTNERNALKNLYGIK